MSSKGTERKRQPAHVEGKKVGVGLVDLQTSLLLPSFHSKDHSEVYVQAMDGQTYGIRLQNYTKDVLTTKVYVDGNLVANQYLWCHQLSTVEAVCSAVELGLDGIRTETHQPLMFSRARVILDTQPSDAHFADKEAVHEHLDKLGKVVVEVRRAEKMDKPIMVKNRLKPMVEEEQLMVEVSEQIGKKKAIFAVHTTLASATSVQTKSETEESYYRHGKEIVETLEFSYGTEAALRVNAPGLMVKKKRGWVEAYGYDPSEVVGQKRGRQQQEAEKCGNAGGYTRGYTGGKGRERKKKGKEGLLQIQQRMAAEAAAEAAKAAVAVEVADEDEEPEPEILHWDFTI